MSAIDRNRRSLKLASREGRGLSRCGRAGSLLGEALWSTQVPLCGFLPGVFTSWSVFRPQVKGHFRGTSLR